jgi:hypothetical protein
VCRLALEAQAAATRLPRDFSPATGEAFVR